VSVLNKEWQNRVAIVMLAVAGVVLLVLNALDLLWGWFIYPDGTLAIVLGVIIVGALLLSRPDRPDSG
jgi:CHASE2 domain-containing sensor protein